MPDYAVRITHSYDIAKKIVAMWALKSTKMAVFQHVGEKTEKPHIHLSLEGTSVDKKQLRNLAASTGIPVKGNEYMSFKDLSSQGEKYFIYMTKGKYDASYLKGYTEEDVQRWKSQWVESEEYQKVSKWEELGMKFMHENKTELEQITEQYNKTYMVWMSNGSSVPPKDGRYEEVSRLVSKFINSKYRGWVPPQGRIEHRFLVFNVCKNLQMSLPADYRY